MDALDAWPKRCEAPVGLIWCLALNLFTSVVQSRGTLTDLDAPLRPKMIRGSHRRGRSSVAACPVVANKDMNKDKNTAHRKIGRVHWLDDVAEHDYTAAENYLSIKFDQATVADAVKKLRKALLVTRRANDILRAAGLEAAGLDDPGVMRDLVKVVEGEPLSPVLVVNARYGPDIADGYHRISLIYRLDPYGEVPLKLA
jgi:hypothetical protein